MLWIVTLLLLGLSVVLLVRAGGAASRAQAVHRVQVPARSLGSRLTPTGTVHDVEYPGPDGRPLHGEVPVVNVHLPSEVYGFHGSVWVNPADPTDITPLRSGRNRQAVALGVAGGVVMVVAFITGLWALIAALPAWLGLPT